ncbi:histidine phosphatase family protein [Deinococcus irradiatisoli]|uniref:Histidine phosphatase family protein n=1 Tax=Deinococcus irradiatisoli TaxID=2202254 RepID=A0A2Z3J9Z2_9DEIO|nr:histidine phosphatase family protein [Deinococcus irradiatisoli]AWN21822.1 histidine phosphatase family protein [Deinococcus irradiatisoli]
MSRGAENATLLLARHGRTAYNQAGRIQGRSVVPLDEVGVQEARHLAAHLQGLPQPPTQLWSSDLLRAEQTAGEVAARLNLPVRLDARLREQDFGEYEGRALSGLLETDPAFREAWTQDFSLLHPPGGERFADTAARLRHWFEDARPRQKSEVVLAVSHGLALHALLCELTGLNSGEARRRTLFHHANAAYTALTLDPASGRLLEYSAVQSGHLPVAATSSTS